MRMSVDVAQMLVEALRLEEDEVFSAQRCLAAVLIIEPVDRLHFNCFETGSDNCNQGLLLSFPTRAPHKSNALLAGSSYNLMAYSA